MGLDQVIHGAGKAVAIIGLPAYIGVVDKPIIVFAAYAALAGCLLSMADTLTDPAAHYVHHPGLVALRTMQKMGTVGLLGGSSYLIAILTI